MNSSLYTEVYATSTPKLRDPLRKLFSKINLLAPSSTCVAWVCGPPLLALSLSVWHHFWRTPPRNLYSHNNAFISMEERLLSPFDSRPMSPAYVS